MIKRLATLATLVVLSTACLAQSVPSPAAAQAWPIYVNASMLIPGSCITRGGVCAGKDVTYFGVYIDQGVIRTQPGEGTNGHSEVSFLVPTGARRLLFTVGDPYTGTDCRDPHKTGMLMYVYVDGKKMWEIQVWQNFAISGNIVLPPGSHKITLVGNTSDGPYDCDDSAWALMRFDQ